MTIKKGLIALSILSVSGIWACNNVNRGPLTQDNLSVTAIQDDGSEFKTSTNLALNEYGSAPSDAYASKYTYSINFQRDLTNKKDTAYVSIREPNQKNVLASANFSFSTDVLDNTSYLNLDCKENADLNAKGTCSLDSFDAFLGDEDETGNISSSKFQYGTTISSAKISGAKVTSVTECNLEANLANARWYDNSMPSTSASGTPVTENFKQVDFNTGIASSGTDATEMGPMSFTLTCKAADKVIFKAVIEKR